MPEPERRATLIDLLEAQTELVKNLEKFPIASVHVRRSEVTQKERLDLEQKLVKVDRAIKLYSSPPVFANY